MLKPPAHRRANTEISPHHDRACSPGNSTPAARLPFVSTMSRTHASLPAEWGGDCCADTSRGVSPMAVAVLTAPTPIFRCLAPFTHCPSTQAIPTPHTFSRAARPDPSAAPGSVRCRRGVRQLCGPCRSVRHSSHWSFIRPPLPKPLPAPRDGGFAVSELLPKYAPSRLVTLWMPRLIAEFISAMRLSPTPMVSRT